MVFFGNLRMEAEPFEESQGAESPKSVASPDELKAFYSDMERQEVVQRNLSRRKSGSVRSLFSRKTTVPPSLDTTTPATVTELKTSEQEKVMEGEHEELKDQVPSMQSRSIIPDQLQQLPSWFTKEDWAGVPIPSQKMRYPMHNPVGPRWYINHHLLPSFRSTQLPSIFSPSFPPMAPTVHESSPDSTRAPDTSRTSSGSPLPTPTSSETRIADNGGRRSRKTSQTAHDTVDLLDVSDPWGTNWHHQSPYDIGLNPSPASPDVPEGSNQTRSRVSSMTTGQRRRTMPSPLSQSTSAVHLRVPDSAGSRIPRKFSKRRRPVLGSLFHGRSTSSEDVEPKAVSLPTSPIEHPSASEAPSMQAPEMEDNGSKRNSALRQSTNVPSPTPTQPAAVDKKLKRGSVLGRLAKRFSIMRKPLQESTRDRAGGDSGRDSDEWHHVGLQDAHSDEESRRSVHIARYLSPEKQEADPRKSIDPVKRVPPPSLESGTVDRSSSISVEAPFSIGRLTIANPDTPKECVNTPTQLNTSLPSDLQPNPINPEHQRRPSDTSDKSPLPAGSSTTSPPALPLGVDDTQKQQSHTVASTEVLQVTGYLMSKLLPDPIPSPRQPVDSPEISRSLAEPEEAKYKAVPGPPDARSTQLPVSVTEVPLVNTHESPKPQSSGPSTTHQAQPSTDSGHVSRAAPPTSESRIPKPTSGSSQTRPVTEPAECMSESGRSRFVASPPVHSAVPFPLRVELLPSIPAFDPIRLSAAPVVVDSPLSAASMFVHPPTPHDSPASVPIYAPPLPQKAVLEEKRTVTQDIPITKAKNESFSTGRQTETFKLVRSASGNLYPMGNSIIAAGQQWEVVESDVSHRIKAREKSIKSKEFGSKEKGSKERGSKERGSKERESKERESKRKTSRERVKEQGTKERGSKERESKDKESKRRESKESVSKDWESGNRREQKRQDRSKGDTESEVERRRTTRQRNGRVPEHSTSTTSSSRRPRTHSMDVRHHSGTQDPTLSNQGEHKPSRKRDEDKERRSERSGETVKPLIQIDFSKPQPPPPPPTPGPPAPAKLERRSSTSNRPVSELPLTAELNTLRARDAWEMDRLCKGRSMYGAETNGSAAPASVASHEAPPAQANGDLADASHGSSHTSFMVQTPFQVAPTSSNIYHSMPSGPPPVIYDAAPSLSQSSYHPAVQNYTDNHRSLPASIPLPSQDKSSFSQLANPLPEPPRESQYTPALLPDSKGGHSADYWTKYAGVTKTH